MKMRRLFFIVILIISLSFISFAQTSTGIKIDKNTLIYLFGNFIEINKKQKMYNIEKIEYQTTRCFGTCPQFNIVIEKSKNATFNAQHHNRKDKNEKEIKGKYKTIIKDEDFDLIVNALNDIDFPNLKDKYTTGHRDTQACFLTITYNEGKVKKIKDYGLSGTLELKNFYNLMFELRFNQKWEKEKK